MHPFAIIAIVFAGLLVLASVFWLIGFARSYRVRDWVRTGGMVVSRRGSLTGWPERYPTFEWTAADGRRYRHTSSVYATFGPRPGSPVVVLYDPADPGRGQMDTFVQSGKIFMVIAYVIAGVGLMGSLFAAWVASAVLSWS